MADDRHYVPGTFYRIDDRTGFKTRSYRTRKEWNGLIVSDRVWEARQPQDFVKGVADNQTVPEARPRQPNAYIAAGNGNAMFQIEPYSDPAVGTSGNAQCFNVFYNSFLVLHGNAVSAANYPSGF